jgi:hypothetical protein
MPYAIYGLTASDDPVIRYVGMTGYHVQERLGEHIAASRRMGTAKDKWIREVHERGATMQAVVLERCETATEARALELQWTRHYLASGLLLNTSRLKGSGKPKPAPRIRQPKVVRIVTRTVGRAKAPSPSWPAEPLPVFTPKPESYYQAVYGEAWS